MAIADPSFRQSESKSSPLLSTPSIGSLVGRRIGRYEILCELAHGGMATVYIARAQAVAGFERIVAVKLLHPHLAHEEEFVSMFLDEARLAARIRHPHVVGTIDISDSEGDGYFLVMDYIEGDHLGRILGEAARRGGRIPMPIAARVVVDALAGLSAAHALTDDHGRSLGLVHRDVSPANLLLGTDGVARITDFGVARAEARVASTQAGQFKGKLAYMAPEQASTGECDQRSDLFAMAIVLWEVLTARRLFRGETNAATLARLLHEPIPMPSSVDPELAAWDPVLARGLERDRDARYQSADEFIAAIEDVALTHGGIATPRALANLVRDLAAKKIDDEQQRIRVALTGYGIAGEPTRTKSSIPPLTSGVVSARKTDARIPLPVSRSEAPVAASASGATLASATTESRISVPTLLESPLPTPLVDDRSHRSTVILVAALVLVASMAGLAGYFASRATRAEPQVIIQSAPPTAPVAGTTNDGANPEPTSAPRADEASATVEARHSSSHRSSRGGAHRASAAAEQEAIAAPAAAPDPVPAAPAPATIREAPVSEPTDSLTVEDNPYFGH